MGMTGTDEGRAFELADAVAWFNQQKRKSDFCDHKELVDKIKSLMEQDLLK